MGLMDYLPRVQFDRAKWDKGMAPILGLLNEVSPGWGDYRAANRGSRLNNEAYGLLGEGEYLSGASKLAEGVTEQLTALPLAGDIALGAKMMAPALAGIFMGRNSRTWDKGAEELAEQMAEKVGLKNMDVGSDEWMRANRAIHQQTGTHLGPDGKWRQEIDDSAARVTDSPSWMGYMGTDDKMMHGGLVSDALDHAPLYASYPAVGSASIDAAEISSRFNHSGRGGAKLGSADLAYLYAPDKRSFTNIGLHETQHGVQHLEDFALGGNPETVLEGWQNKRAIWEQRSAAHDIARDLRRGESLDDTLEAYEALGLKVDPVVIEDAKMAASNDDFFNSLSKWRKEAEREWLALSGGSVSEPLQPYEAYRRLAGEAEARAVQKRMDYPASKRREVFPLDDYDVPVSGLLYR